MGGRGRGSPRPPSAERHRPLGGLEAVEGRGRPAPKDRQGPTSHPRAPPGGPSCAMPAPPLSGPPPRPASPAAPGPSPLGAGRATRRYRGGPSRSGSRLRRARRLPPPAPLRPGPPRPAPDADSRPAPPAPHSSVPPAGGAGAGPLGATGGVVLRAEAGKFPSGVGAARFTRDHGGWQCLRPGAAPGLCVPGPGAPWLRTRPSRNDRVSAALPVARRAEEGPTRPRRDAGGTPLRKRLARRASVSGRETWVEGWGTK